ncbi:protein-glutamate methylesterase/protein-glutamine glutaminase [Eionea flava]
MPITVLIVDDSSFFQRVLKEIISENTSFNVVGVASNGQEAIEKVKSLQPDVVTMDYEMPMMDGVTAVREIMASNPLPILMLSSMTFSGAKITIDALEAGAADFMTKNFAEISGKGAAIKKRLYDILTALSQSKTLVKNSKEGVSNAKKSPTTATLLRDNNASGISCSVVSSPKASPANQRQSVEEQKSTVAEATYCLPNDRTLAKTIKLVAIGASTGGPAALTELLKPIPANFRLPILIIQHMPENFTLAFSQRLKKQCNIEVKEAEDGDYIQPGRALLAPGGKQMIVDKNNKNRVKVTDSTTDIHYKPCIDISFASISNSYNDTVLGIILTGMGSDGCDGARLLKQKKSTIWTQSEDSCVVYGMPMAVDKAQLSSASLNIYDMADCLKKF